MAMPQGTKKWSTLATWNDQAVIEYFRTQRGQNEGHAKNSLRMLRRHFDPQGNKRAIPLPRYDIPSDQREPSNGVENFPPREQPKSSGIDHAPEPEMEIEVPKIDMPDSDPMAPLAKALLPHLLKNMQQPMADFLNGMREKMSTRIVILNEKKEATPLDGTHHVSAAKVISLAATGLNVLMVGPAGCGKTVIASSVQQALKAKSLTVVSCSAGMSESQLAGRLLPMGANGAFVYVASPFIQAYENGGVILLDEIDAADANLLLFINAALANGGIEIEARAASGLPTYVKRHKDTIILAAANTWGSGADVQYVGRGALDASTLDRFYRVAVDYDQALEAQLGETQVVSWVQNIRHHASRAKLRRVVSTRMILRITKAMQGGLTFEQACSDELAPWSQDERTKVYAS